ncbi:MAG: HPr(Ser) kinase/phosphatase [Verrucomicrobia bacterium]|nr:HPr(Ser) kinase/phosphatase [Verrucomicrobiota bacterium]NBS79150.1 HPr(Ser) kinase/phosphatase [bacterium]NBT23869.1 HPr(Ser) kinase/phosphatase [bacterium]NBV96710.1 HPr(Ser) kinase/phosphatase [Verrucomicrobiota bacterium]NBY66935.1 HPr(Ser) kinase/phosphatase [Verrucomicrobiota bacterium]
MKKPLTVSVEHFYTQHAARLQLKLVAGQEGMGRLIREGAVNRLGMALTGFIKYFAFRRVQLIGKSEISYFLSLDSDTRQARIRAILDRKIPCIVFSRNNRPPAIILKEAEKAKVPIFISPIPTPRLVNLITLCLEEDFAPTTSEHGSMVDIMGVGVLIRGESGVGKSECALGLVERGYSLVADDITRLRLLEGRELMATSAEVTRTFMEVRGIGIINVAAIFGGRAIRTEKRLDLVVTLAEWDQVGDIERTGLDQQFYEILGLKIPHVRIPIRPGRDLAGLVQVAALDQKMKTMGQFSALEFNEKLMSRLKLKEG